MCTSLITTTMSDSEDEDRPSSAGALPSNERPMSLMEKARFKLRNGWKNDASALQQYFDACVANWKVYKGDKNPKQVMKLQSIYRQAKYGDNPQGPPQNLKSVNGLKWQMWKSLEGMPIEMAKRRFITYLAEIDPMLIDVMADEKPPDGFCRDENNIAICAKCNTKGGCMRPILDQHKIDLKDQLFDSDELLEAPRLRKWVRNALANQRCIWGLHKPVAKIDVKPFQGWFDKEENGGFVPYDSTKIYDLIREFLYYHFEIAFDMQCNLSEYPAEQFNTQVSKVNKIQAIYEELSGERFVFEGPCTSKSALCNERRLAEGGRNHTHPVVLQPPSAKDLDDYSSATELREQCKRLGLKETTGVVDNVQHRCEIYRTRISDYFKGLEIASEAKSRLDARADIHAREKDHVKNLSQAMMNRQMSDACHAFEVDHAVVLIKRGCDPNWETRRGMFPLLTAVLNLSPTETIETLVNLKCNINRVSQFGLTPLIIACRTKDQKMIHVLFKLGVSAMQDTGFKGAGMTAMHWCAVHGCEEEAKIITEYVKEGGGDSMRIARLLDCESHDGETPLMLAARLRNGLMCKTLTSLGANPNVRNKIGRNAYNIARQLGWQELADWLETKVGSGVAKVETYSDQQYDSKVRYGKVRMIEKIEEWGRMYLGVVHTSETTSPLGPPSTAINARALFGARAEEEQRNLLDLQQMYVLHKDRTGHDFKIELDDDKGKKIVALSEFLHEMVENIRKGTAAANTEALAKPLPWTPLMCAVALNDVKQVKKLIRNGADVNHPNMQGTTSLMLACQLQNLDMLQELVELGANLDLTDNCGYTALAYASSFPTPSNMQKSEVDVITEGGSAGEMRRDASEMIKFIAKKGLAKLKQLEKEAAENPLYATQAGENESKINDVISRHDLINQKRAIKLLERQGLSHVVTDKQMTHALSSTKWRLKKIRREGEEDVESEEEKEEVVEEEEEEKVVHLRCPICTLIPPCSHFMKETTLRKFLNKNLAAEEEENAAKEEKAQQDVSPADLARLGAAAGKLLKEKRKKAAADKVLKEVGIFDRSTDRSFTFSQKYRPMEMQLEARQEAQRLKDEEEERLALEKEKRLAIEAKERLVLEALELKQIALKEEKNKEEEKKASKKKASSTPSKQQVALTIDTHRSSADSTPLATPGTGGPKKVRFDFNGDMPTPDGTAGQQQFVVRSEDDEIERMKAELEAELARMQGTTSAPTTPTKKEAASGDGANKLKSKLLGKKKKLKELVEEEAKKSDEQKEEELEQILTEEQKQNRIRDMIFKKKFEHPLPPDQRRLMRFMKDPFNKYVNSVALPPDDYVPNMYLSAWALYPQGNVDFVPPIDKIELKLEAWSHLVEHMWATFTKKWLVGLNWHTCPKPGQPLNFPALRCKQCKIGFVRLNNIRGDLCLPCVARREMHDCIDRLIPGFFTKKKLLWPYRPSKVSDDELEVIKNQRAVQEVNPPSSPTHSRRMQEIDLYYALKDPGTMTYDPNASFDGLSSVGGDSSIIGFGVGPGGNSNSLTPIKGASMKMSGSVSSLEQPSIDSLPNSLSQITIPSQFTNDTADEMTDKHHTAEQNLLALLLGKGQYEEVERMSRVTISLKTVDEGEGILVMIKAMTLQADMYKMMGLYPLALGIYLDCFDHIVNVMGYSDNNTANCLRTVIQALLNMRCLKEATTYVHTICHRLEQETLGETNFMASQVLALADKNKRKQMVRYELIYSQHIAPDLESVERTPLRHYRYTIYKYMGPAGLFHMYTGRDGYSSAARYQFEAYCMRIDPEGLGNFARFAAILFKMRLSSNEDLTRTYIQTIVQYHLARRLMKTNDLSRHYHEHASDEHNEKMHLYMYNGVPFNIDEFDFILLYALQRLSKPFFLFYLRDGGAGMRENNVKRTARTFHAVATRMQTFARGYIARLKVRTILHDIAVEKERQRRAYEAAERGETDSDSD